MSDPGEDHAGPAPNPANQSKQPPARPHVCQHPGCTASYARIEHLDRHVKSHDPAHSYTCDECGKSFARTDVLQRHLKIHERDRRPADNHGAAAGQQTEGSSGTGGGSYTRVRGLNRVSRACRSCASAKAKCSGDKPCQRCVELGRECEFEPTSARPSKRVRIGSQDTEGSVPPAAYASSNGTAGGANGLGDISVADAFQSTSNSPPHHSQYQSHTSMMPPMPPVFPPATAAPGTLHTSEFMVLGTSRGADEAQQNGHMTLPVPPSALGRGSSVDAVSGAPRENLDNFVSLALQQQQQHAQPVEPPYHAQSQATQQQQQQQQAQQQFNGFPAVDAYGGFPSGLEADLAAAFYLPADDGMFWSSFLTSPPAAPHLASSVAPHTAQISAAVTVTVPADANSGLIGSTSTSSGGIAAVANAGSVGLLSDLTEPSPTSSSSPHAHGRRRRIMISASGLPSRHGSPRPESDDGHGGADEGGANGASKGEHASGSNPFASGSAGGLTSGIFGGNGYGLDRGLPKRPHARTAPSWPMVWDPTGEESAIRLESEASLSLLMIGGTALGGSASRIPKFDEDTRIALLETLRFAQLSDDEYHAIYRSLAKIPLSVFDLLCGLYFQHFHRVMPMFHVPSFSPKKTLGQLLLIILGVGAIYAPVPGAFQLGRVMIEVARRGVEHLINRDNRLARSLPVAQSQLLACTLRWIGSARTIELTEALRGVHVAILRRLRVFDESLLHKPVDDSPVAQWKAFIANEERRRTAMACFVLEGEVTTLMHTPPIINASEIKTLLPCPEKLWEAPSAEEWLELKRGYQEPMAVQTLAKLLASESSVPLPASISLGPFGAQVLIQGLHLMVHNARQLHLSGLTNHAELVTTQIRRSLCRLSRGPDEFTPRFGGNANSIDEPSVYAAPRVGYHLAHLATHIPLEELDLVALKAGEVAAMNTLDKWTSWMGSQAERARTIALHSGQILRIVRDYPTHATFEPSALFYAGLCLYVYSRSVLSVQITSASESPPEKGSPFPLDADLQGAEAPDAGIWLALGGPASLADLSLTISSNRESSGVSVQILRTTSQHLAQLATIWRIASVFGLVLDNLVRRDETAAARMASFDSAAAAAFA